MKAASSNSGRSQRIRSSAAGAFGGAEPEKMRHEHELEIASRTDALDLRQCLAGQLARLAAHDDPVRADAMCGKLFDQSVEVCGRPENLHAIDRAAKPPRLLVKQRNNPPLLGSLRLQELHEKNRPVVQADQDHVLGGGASRLLRTAAVSISDV